MADIIEGEITVSGTNVTLTTTTETSCIASPAVTVPSQTARLMVLAWGQLTTGAGTTAVTPRIRRDNTTSGALVGEANAEEVKAAAGSTEPFFILAVEERANLDRAQYNLTLTQTGATGNGTFLQGGILVLVMGG